VEGKYVSVFEKRQKDTQRLLRLLKLLAYVIIFWVASRCNDLLRAERPRGRSSSPGMVKNFHFSMSSRPVLGTTQPPIQWVPGPLSPRDKAAWT
jgi:hypothetical protein